MAKSGLMNKRIPTLLGLLILLGGLGAGIVLVNMRQGLESKAGPTESPKNIKVSNKGSNTFSVSWTTDIPLTGYVRYSDNPAKITLPAGDARDQISGSSQSYTNHYVNITGLNANTTYYFLIGSGSQTYDDGGKPFQIRTTLQAIAPPEDVIYGKVVGAGGNPVNGAILYVEVEGGQTLSAMTKTDGTWRLNLATAKDKDGKVLTYDPAKALLSIFVQAGSAGTATAITDTGHDKPVNDIELGKNQSFVEGVAAPLSEASPSATITNATESGTVNQQVSGFKSQLDDSGTTETPVQEISLAETLSTSPIATGATALTTAILNPAIDGEMIATSTPQFKGMAAPNSTVKITVHSDAQLTAIVKADSSGTWTWTPPKALDSGSHTITVEFTDVTIGAQKVTRPFSILSAVASAGLPAFTATPSATPTLAVTSTPSASPTEIQIMPATESGELSQAGALSTTILLVAGGVMLIVLGKYSRRWTE